MDERRRIAFKMDVAQRGERFKLRSPFTLSFVASGSGLDEVIVLEELIFICYHMGIQIFGIGDIVTL